MADAEKKGDGEMNLYLLTQTVNDAYDTYDSCVVAAESAEDAAKMLPTDGGHYTRKPSGEEAGTWVRVYWATPEQVTVRLIGVAAEGIKAGDVICASFNAG